MSKRYEVPLISKSVVAPSITEITLDISGTDFRFKAGQYATITLPNTTDQPTTSQFHDFSIVSSPNNHEQLKVAFRNSESFFKQTILDLPLGANVILEGPSGNFVLPEKPDKPLVFIAGGIGITPFISMLSFINEAKQPYQVTLFYSNRDAVSTAYDTELQELAKLNPALKIVFTMTNYIQWKGETRAIGAELLTSYMEDMADHAFYIAGPPAMVFAIQDELRQIGISDEHIHTEGFTGLVIEQVLTGSDYNALISSLDKTALVSMTDAKGHIVYANNRFIEVSKYSLKELLGQNHRILKSGHQPAQLFIELWDTISHGKVWRGEIKNKAKDGTYYWVDTSIAPIMGADGVPERYISVRFLITERKEKEETLSGLLSALDQTALVSMTDAKGSITYANQKFVDVSKYALYELMGQNHRLLKSGMQPQSLFEELWDTISHGKVWRGEIKNKAKDGTYYWVDTSIAPIMGVNNVPERYISVRFLITDRKQRERLLQQAKAMDEAILASIGHALIGADQNGRVILINPEAQRLLGWTASEAIGAPIEEVLPIKDGQDTAIPVQQRPFRQVLTTKQTITMPPDNYFVRKNGEKFPAAASLSPIMLDNTAIGVIEVFQEITPKS
ncbi:MAG TPA: PAS domain-containing protein [Candidatus Saccharimonadales bacterium]